MDNSSPLHSMAKTLDCRYRITFYSNNYIVFVTYLWHITCDTCPLIKAPQTRGAAMFTQKSQKGSQLGEALANHRH